MTALKQDNTMPATNMFILPNGSEAPIGTSIITCVNQHYIYHKLESDNLYVWCNTYWDKCSDKSLERVIRHATCILWVNTSLSYLMSHFKYKALPPVSAPKTQGQKFDTGKPRFSLLPQSTLVPVLRVLEAGAVKYSVNNWQHVENPRERYYDAAMRHLYAWFNGESKDPETGESHLAHAICCLLFLLWFDTK